MQVDLKWFHEMSWIDWEVFAEKDSTTSSTTHLNCRGDCDSDWYSSFRQMETLSAQENLTQLEIAELIIALRPLKEDLVRWRRGSCSLVQHIRQAHGGIGELQCGDSKQSVRQKHYLVKGFEANCQKHYLVKKSAGNCLV
jgi:hypothetical protein